MCFLFVYISLFVFFFKQKTAYEMRISDWSSDVCSSDLLRPFGSLGAANHGWLDAHHHFSFADYHDPARTNWGRLRVWNDDTIAPKTGFPSHPHRDMEIVTYVRKGAIKHQDSLGNKGRTEAGAVQVLSTGTGIVHPEPTPQEAEGKRVG